MLTFDEWVQLQVEVFDREETERVMRNHGPWLGDEFQTNLDAPYGMRSSYGWLGYDNISDDVTKKVVSSAMSPGSKLIDFDNDAYTIERLIKLPDGSFKAQFVDDDFFPDLRDIFNGDLKKLKEIKWKDIQGKNLKDLSSTWQNAIAQRPYDSSIDSFDKDNWNVISSKFEFPTDEREFKSFIQALRANPTDEMAYLVFADWLEENGKLPAANFIRDYIENIKGQASNSYHKYEKNFLPKAFQGLLRNLESYI